MTRTMTYSEPWRSDPRPRRGLRVKPGKQRHTTHSRRSAKVLYRLHPLYGEEVEILRDFTKRPRSFLVEPHGAISPVIPGWVLDPAACAHVRCLEEPAVSLCALRELRALLDAQQALLDASAYATVDARQPQGEQNVSSTSSDAPGSRSGAPLGSSRRGFEAPSPGTSRADACRDLDGPKQKGDYS